MHHHHMVKIWIPMCAGYPSVMLVHSPFGDPIQRRFNDKPNYSIFLPYSVQQDAATLLQEILDGLATAVASGDVIPGTFPWTRRLFQFLDIKGELPLESRLKLARFYAALLALPVTRDTFCYNLWASALLKLIRKDETVIPDNVLALEWRPLYNVIHKFCFPHERAKVHLTDVDNIADIFACVTAGTRFFSSGSTAEILEQFLPLMYPNAHYLVPSSIPVYSSSPNSTLSMLSENLVHFLPNDTVTALCYLSLFLPTNTEHTDMWFDKFWMIWHWQRNSMPVWSCLLSLYSRIAQDRAGHITWHEDKIVDIFTFSLRFLEISVNNDTGMTGKFPAIGRHFPFLQDQDAKKLCAKIIVHVLSPNSAESVFSKLHRLVESTELFFHPSNLSRHTRSMTSFLSALISQLRNRLDRESSPDCKTPVPYRITPAMKKRFTEIVKPTVLTGLFSSDRMIVSSASHMLHILAYFEPGLILPDLLEKLPSLDSLIEAHRATSIISALAAAARPLMARHIFPSGATYLATILSACLPGIDNNDPPKTLGTLRLITNILCNISVAASTADVSSIQSIPGSTLEIENDVWCTTLDLQDWALQFWNRCWIIYEQCAPRSRVASIETAMPPLMHYALHVLFENASPAVLTVIGNKIIDQVVTSSLPNCSRLIATVCTSLVTANRDQMLPKFLPRMIKLVMEEVRSGSGIEQNSNSFAENKLSWLLAITAGLLKQMGTTILSFRNDLNDMFEILTQSTAKMVIKFTGKALRNLLRSLTTIYALEAKIVAPTVLAEKGFSDFFFQRYGFITNAHYPNVSWHVPNAEEIDYACFIIKKFLGPSLTLLQNVITPLGSKAENFDRNLLLKHLKLCRYILRGMSTLVVDMPQNSGVGILEESNIAPNSPKKRLLQTGYCLMDRLDPRCREMQLLRLSYATMLHNCALFIQTNLSDDIQLTKVLLKAIRSFFADRGIEPRKGDTQKSTVRLLKSMSRSYEVGSPRAERYPRFFLMHIINGQHTRRLQANAAGLERLQIHNVLLNDLFSLSLSPYTEIRRRAQDVLSSALVCFPTAKFKIIEKLFNAFDNQASITADELKGAIYICRLRVIQNTLLRNWRYLPAFFKSLLKIQSAEKTSIQKLVEATFLEYSHRFVSPTLSNVVSPQLCEVAVQLSKVAIDPSGTNSLETLNTKAFLELRTFLLMYLRNEEKDVHWKYQTIAALMVSSLLVREDQPVDDSTFQLIVKNCVAELLYLRQIAISSFSTISSVNKLQCLRNQKKSYKGFQRGASRNAEALISSEVDFVKSCFQDKSNVGWHFFPRNVTVYSPNEGSIGAIIREPWHVLKTPSSEYMISLLKYAAEELVDDCSSFYSYLRFYRSLFELFESTILLPSVIETVSSFARDVENRNHQRAAAEFLFGALRASKHWHYSQLQTLQQWIANLLQIVVVNATLESISYWTLGLQYGLNNRDPARNQVLIASLMSLEVNSASASPLAEVKKLHFMRVILIVYNYRMPSIAEKLLRDAVALFSHPYKEFREMAALIISDIFHLSWRPSLGAFGATGLALATPIPIKDIGGTVPALFSRLNALRSQRKLEDKLQPSEYANLAKSVNALVINVATSARIAPLLSHLPVVVIELGHMLDDENEELQGLSKRSLGFLFQNVLPASHVVIALQSLCAVVTDTESTSWHVRLRLLGIIQVFLFRNMFCLDSTDFSDQICEHLVMALTDPQLEVRSLASKTICGYVRSIRREAAAELRVKFESLLRTPAPWQTGSTSSYRQPDKADDTAFKAHINAIIKRHAGVLGLSSLVQAFPYSVPSWMPSVLESLARYVSDPMPIQSTVKQAFLDFRRTHQDSWFIDKEAFTPRQLEKLTDLLVSPSYYV